MIQLPYNDTTKRKTLMKTNKKLLLLSALALAISSRPTNAMSNIISYFLSQEEKKQFKMIPVSINFYRPNRKYSNDDEKNVTLKTLIEKNSLEILSKTKTAQIYSLGTKEIKLYCLESEEYILLEYPNEDESDFRIMYNNGFWNKFPNSICEVKTKDDSSITITIDQ